MKGASPVRRTFNVLSATCAFLFAAVCVLWLRSYWRTDAVPFTRHQTLWHVESARGRLAVSNDPQRDLESREHARAAAAASKEVVRALDRWRDRERAVTEAMKHDLKAWDGAKPELAALKETQQESTRRLVTSWKAPRYRTPPERHAVPHWALAGLLAVLPAAWLMHFAVGRRARSRRKRGLCVACGYDLRSTPNRCPECGSVPAKGATT